MKDYFLSSLGILDTDQVRSPTKDAFPLAFNVNNHRVWDAVIQGFKQTDNPAADWSAAIHLYIERCVGQGLYPFSNVHQSSNDSILRELNDGRKAVVKFMNLSRILQLINLSSTTRQVKMTNTGFCLKVSGKAKLKDPSFPQWLTKIPMPGFQILKVDERYIKNLSGTTTIIAYNEGANLPDRWHLGYEIIVNRFPDIPGNQLPSRAELEKFILTTLWMPILKAHRPQGFHHRLI
jgi:hypothetical protein